MLRQRDHGLSRCFQNLCHVSSSHWRGLEFCTEPDIHILFKCMTLILQFSLLTIFQTPFSVKISKFHIIFLLFPQNLVDFLQIKVTTNFLCTTITYSENPEGESLQEESVLCVFKNLPIFKPSARNSNPVAECRKSFKCLIRMWDYDAGPFPYNTGCNAGNGRAMQAD